VSIWRPCSSDLPDPKLMVQSMCQPLHSLYRKFGSRLSVTKDTLLVVSPQVLATFCKLLRLVLFPGFVSPRLKPYAFDLESARLSAYPPRNHYAALAKSTLDPHLSFRHVATEKSIAVTCYTGSVSGATSSMLPCCSRNTRWQRRANAKLWVAMREVN